MIFKKMRNVFLACAIMITSMTHSLANNSDEDYLFCTALPFTTQILSYGFLGTYLGPKFLFQDKQRYSKYSAGNTGGLIGAILGLPILFGSAVLMETFMGTGLDYVFTVPVMPYYLASMLFCPESM